MSGQGDRIRTRREQIGMSQAELARRSGVSAASVNDWESGKTQNISGAALLKAAQAMGVSPGWIVAGDDEQDGDGVAAVVQRRSPAQEIGRRMRFLRQAAKVTQSELGERTGLSQATIARYETGSAAMPLDTASGVASALGVELSELVGGGEGAPQAPADPSQATRPDRGILITAVTMVEEVLAELRITYPPRQRAELVVACYIALEDGQLRDAARGFVRAFLEAQKLPS